MMWAIAARLRPRRITGSVIGRGLGGAAQKLAGGFILTAAVTTLFAPRMPAPPYDRTLVLALLAPVLAVVLAVPLLVRRLRRAVPHRAAAMTGPLLVVAATAGCTVLAWSQRYPVGWDARMVADLAEALELGLPLSQNQSLYLSHYPNNLPLVLVNQWALRLGGQLGLPVADVFVLLNGLALAGVLAATYALVTMLRDRAAAVVALLPVTALFGLSMWMAVPYTDVLAAPFVSGAVAAAVGAGRVRPPVGRLLLGLLSVACVVLAVLIKTTPVVIIVAVLVAGLLGSLCARGAARLLVPVALLAGAGASIWAVSWAQQEAPALAGIPAGAFDRSLTPPPSWWVYMGAVQRTVNGREEYGGYNGEIVLEYRYLSADQIDELVRPRLQQRLEHLGPGGLLRFELDKAAWTWGDGMFSAWGEGTDLHAAPTDTGALAAAVRPWQYPVDDRYRWRVAAAQALWLVLLLALGLRLLWAPFRWEHCLVALTVLGIGLFTLIFQGRARYLLSYAPVVLALTVALPAPTWLRSRGRAGARPAVPQPADQGGRLLHDRSAA